MTFPFNVHVIASCEKRKLADVLVLPFYKGEKQPVEMPDTAPFMPTIESALSAGDFRAKVGELLWVYPAAFLEKRILLLGLGEESGLSVEHLRRAYGALAKACRDRKVARVNILLPKALGLPCDLIVRGVCEGLFLGEYSYEAMKGESTKDEPVGQLKKVYLLGEPVMTARSVVEEVSHVMRGVALARDLVNGNADDVTPQHLAEVAKGLASAHPRIETTVHQKDWIARKGMGLFLAVARAAMHPPAFIVSAYRGDPLSSDHTVLIGKGLTYDTGGLSLKSAGMEYMKSDMSGAAAVLGVLEAISSAELPINVTGVIAACENAIDATAYKLGDVYRGLSGKTVEITNTDAEGRLTLADALTYTIRELHPSRIIDIATLTGAIDIALGPEAMGLFSNSDALAQALVEAGSRTFERVWKMPLFEEYRELLKSEIADIKNASGRSAGSVLAALFLEEFVDKTPWAHLDIAGCAFTKESRRYYPPKQATGIGVRLLFSFLEGLVELKGEGAWKGV